MRDCRSQTISVGETFKFRHELFKDEATTIRKHLHQCMGVFSARHFPPNAEH